MGKDGNILITGSSGFIGTHLCAFLEACDTPYITLKRRSQFLDTQSPSNSANVSTAHQKANTLELKWPEEISNIDFASFRAIIHLAYPQIKQSEPYENLHQKHILPVQTIISQIERTNSNCHLLFISSQSASPDTTSAYGRIKHETENILLDSTIPYSILVPGLVYGAGGKGLYGQIDCLISLSPFIPVPMGSDKTVQPVYIWDVIQAILRILENPNSHVQKKYYLATKPITFSTFVRKIAESKNVKRALLPVPDALVFSGLGFLECIFKNPPFTRTNYLGLVQLTEIDHETGWKTLDITPHSITDGLKESIQNPYPFLKDASERKLALEARYLFRQVFKQEIPFRILKKFIEAHHFLDMTEETLDTEYMTKENLDAQALALMTGSRTGEKRTFLKSKMLLLSYLAELEPAYRHHFFNKKRSRFYAFPALAFMLLSTLFKYIKGRYILWRHPQCMMQ
jgi:nucleoside-diphosphate-sugar epimerase